MRKALEEWSYQKLALFSLPSLAASLVEPLASLVDTILVGRISTDWLAALAVASAIFNSITWVFNFLIHTSVQAVSSHHSSGKEDFLWSRVKMATLLSLILGVASSLLLWFGRDFWFQVVSADNSYRAPLESYFFVRTMAQPLVLLGFTWLGILRGFSFVRATFVILLITTGLNILLSGLLLYVFEWGIAGAAYGTLMAQVLLLISSAALVIFKVPNTWSSFKKARMHWDLWRSYGRDSFGMLMRSGALSLAFFLSTKFASLLGTSSLAAHQILLHLWLLSSYFIDGLAVTANILCARYLAREDLTTLKEVGKKLVHLSFIVGLIFSMTYLIFGNWLMTLFTSDTNVLVMGSEAMLLMALSQIIVAVAYLYDGLLFGAAKFTALGVMMVIGIIFIALPLFVMSQYGLGLKAIWIGLILLGFYRALVTHQIFKRIVRV